VVSSGMPPRPAGGRRAPHPLFIDAPAGVVQVRPQAVGGAEGFWGNPRSENTRGEGKVREPLVGFGFSRSLIVMDDPTPAAPQAPIAASDGGPRAEPFLATPGSPDQGKVAPDRLPAAVEAILLTHDRPLPIPRLAEALGLVEPSRNEAKAPEGDADGEAPQRGSKGRRGPKGRAGAWEALQAVEAAIATLNEAYARTGRSFRIEPVAGGYRIMTLPEFAPLLASVQKLRAAGRLSRAAVETLAIIAYKQPLTRAHLEAIRGVSCGEVLRSLMERRLVTIRGRAEELGRPILYGTTREFLDAFGLASLKDLPSVAELQTGTPCD
jgi:segregation and condensation protein B